MPTAPAAINAINNAIGVRIKDLPATKDKVLLGLLNKKLQEDNESSKPPINQEA